MLRSRALTAIGKDGGGPGESLAHTEGLFSSLNAGNGGGVRTSVTRPTVTR